MERTSESRRALRRGLVMGLVGLLIIAGAVAYILSRNVAYAVSVNGEFVGYASDVEEINSAVESVSQTVSSALGYDYPVAVAVSYERTLGTGDADITQAVEETLLDGLDVIGEYAILCVDGEPFCAFETTADAAAALAAFVNKFSEDGLDSAALQEDVSVRVDYADSRLLDAAKVFNVLAMDKIHVETVSHSSEEEIFPYSTEIVYDETMYVDEQLLEQTGRSGRRVTLTTETSVNGKVTATESSDVVNVAPVNEIIRVGTKEHISTGSYLWPSDGILTSRFGRRSVAVGSSYHKGIDVAAAYGDPITASDGGTVIFADWESGYGKLVKLEHENGDVTYYGHCSSLAVSVGDVVQQGDVIAYMGATGVASGVHVHFEYRPLGGDPIDPLLVLPEP